MAKKQNAKQAPKAPTLGSELAQVAAPEQPAQVVTEVASTATKLTKRNATPLNIVLVATDKPSRNRAPHVQNAWEAVKKALPATAAELAKLPELADPGCNSPAAFLSYMIRRGFLKAKSE